MTDMPPRPAAAPHVWVLESPHAGDNTQLLALARALGWPFELKKLVYRPGQTLARLVLGGTLLRIDRKVSSVLDAPFPDLVLGCGRPTEAVAFWLRRQKPGLKLVYMGTPWARLDRFDLVITTPQYGLPRRANVIHNALPLHDVGTTDQLRDPTATAVLVGGRSGPYGFDAEAGIRLARAARAAAGAGRLLVTTSKRTPTGTADAIEAALTPPFTFHRWRAGEPNPYHEFLSVADRFIVTADSISMIAEALATGRPVALFDTETGKRSMRAEEHRPAKPDARLPPPHWRGADLDTTVFRLLMRGPASWSRDLRIIHRRMIADGTVHWLGEAAPARQTAPKDADMARALAGIKALFPGAA